METRKDIFNRIPKIGDVITWGIHRMYGTVKIGKIIRFSNIGNPICNEYKVEPFGSTNIVLDTRYTTYPSRQDKAFIIINDPNFN